MDGKIPVKDIEHLTFHPPNITVLENTGTPRPNDVFHHLIVKVLENGNGRDQYDGIMLTSQEEEKKRKPKEKWEETHFASENKCPNEDPLTCPAFGGYLQVWFCSLNID